MADDGGQSQGSGAPAPHRHGARHLAALIRQTTDWAHEGRQTLLTQLLSPGSTPAPWAHLPAGDAHDAAAGYRWYYHCHPDRGRHRSEHGHFHLFADLPDDAARPDGEPGVTHLVAVSVDAWGLPCGLFTVNRWVTDEVIRPAPEILGLIEHFRLASPHSLQPVHEWLRHLLGAFAPQLRHVVLARDRRLAALRQRRGDRALEDRRIAILSRHAVDIGAQARYYDRLERATLAPTTR